MQIKYKIFNFTYNDAVKEQLSEFDGSDFKPPFDHYPILLDEPRWMEDGDNLFSTVEDAFHYLENHKHSAEQFTGYVVLPYYQPQPK